MIPTAETERRRAALEAIVAGERTQSDVAREFEVTRQAVSLWVKRYQEAGKVVGSRGRPAGHLTASQKSELRVIIESQAPSDFNIESEDDRWHWLELYDLLLERTRRRFSRRECMKLLTDWGVADPDISKARKAAHRHHEHVPVSADESAEFMELLAAAREQMERGAAPAPPHAPAARDPKADRRRAKRIDKRRRKQKLAQKQKRKQRRKGRR